MTCFAVVDVARSNLGLYVISLGGGVARESFRRMGQAEDWFSMPSQRLLLNFWRLGIAGYVVFNGGCSGHGHQNNS